MQDAAKGRWNMVKSLTQGKAHDPRRVGLVPEPSIVVVDDDFRSGVSSNVMRVSVESADALWYPSFGSSRKPSYCPCTHFSTPIALNSASFAAEREAAAGSISMSASTCSRCDCTMSRTCPTLSKKPPRLRAPRP